MRKVMIIGCLGMAGHIVKKYLENLGKYDVWGIARGCHTNGNIISLDVSNIIELEKIVSEHSFDIVINCIGILNKTAEDNPELAIWFNSYFPHFLSSLGAKYNYKLIHISTDCVFSGKEGGYTETSFKNGAGYYAKSKALGEIINERDLTFRTSIIGPELKQDGIGLFHWFMNQKETVYGYSKAYWSGVTTIELAKAIDSAVEENLTGLYQLVNNSKINKFDLLNLFNEVFKGDQLEIFENSDYIIDKSLINSRKDFGFTVLSYESMMKEMKGWIENNADMYTQVYRQL